jgi:NAD(P)H-flavin reductase
MAASPPASVDNTSGAGPYAPEPYRVVARTPETKDTSTITLAPAGGGAFPAFAPGQFNMVYAFGIGEAAISIAGAATGRDQLLHTVRATGRVTQALEAARPGTVVGVRGPYGTGWPVASARGRDIVIVAGGLGLPPLRGLIEATLRDRADFGRVEVVYGARTPKDIVYYDAIQAWRRRTDCRIQVTVDLAGREWYGDVGVVTTRIPDMRFEPANTSAFLVGPEIMMKVTAQALEAKGVPADQIWLSMERNMKCAIAQCGHCQFGPAFVCRDGPVFSYAAIRRYLVVREV